jgi:hypothetical protein
MIFKRRYNINSQSEVIWGFWRFTSSPSCQPPTTHHPPIKSKNRGEERGEEQQAQFFYGYGWIAPCQPTLD